jgi:hypothetical protein
MLVRSVGLSIFDVELSDEPECTGSAMGWMHPGLEGVLVGGIVVISVFLQLHHVKFWSSYLLRVISIHYNYI